MKDKNNLIAVPVSRTVLMSFICLCVLQLAPLPAFSQDKKDSKPSTSTQKNTDGTITTTEKYEWGTKATTKDSEGKVIDTVTTKESTKFGKGGTKIKIESHKNGEDIDTVVYKDESGNIRRAEQTIFKAIGIGKSTFDVTYDETGRVTSWADGDLKGIIKEETVGYDASGRPKLTAMKYFGKNENVDVVKDSPSQYYLGKGQNLLAEIREATERHASIADDILPKDPPDKQAPKPKEEDPKKDTKSTTTSTPKGEKPRLGAAPSSRTTPATKPRIATGVSGTIDSCLVGTWRSETITNDVVKQEGGASILLTIKANGTVTIDYNGMTPITGTDLGTNWWTGTATGHITTSNGTAKETSVENSELTHKYTDEQGKTSSNLLSGLGPATLSNRNYTCDETTLTYKAATQTFKFKREKKEPQ